MPTTPSKSLSPAELAKLEHAFATDPSSEAYKPLAEAYLGMGRFMEAMVVCKKGVKAHPSVADPRVLLARVYAEQGKDRKALEELQAALQVNANDVPALRLTGTLQLKVGEADAGKQNLLKALELAPQDEDTRTALAQNKIELPRAAPVAAPPVLAPQAGGPPVLMPTDAAPPQPRAQASSSSVAVAQSASPAPQRTTSSGQLPRTTSSGQVPRASNAAVPPRQAPRRPVESDDDDADTGYRSTRKPTSASSRAIFFLLIAGVPLVTGGYFFYGRYTATRNREIKKQLTAATEELKHDSYASYQKASEAADKALEIDPDSVAAHGYLAYAWAIRWGEHGGGDNARKQTEEHLQEARDGSEVSSHLYAAEALYKAYGGKGKEALTTLEQQVKEFEARGQQSSLMNLTLGIIQMRMGDMERARESLDKAQALAPDDPRIYSALGNLYRRRGQDSLAWKNFDFALRYEKDHPESMLGKSLLLLERDNSNVAQYVETGRMLKKLIEANPPPSPRQLAQAHLARALLVSRVAKEIGDFKPEFQKELTDGTGVTTDANKNKNEVASQEDTGFQLDKQNPELHLIKAKRLLNEEQNEAAIAEIRKAIALDATRAQFYVELAGALMKNKDGAKEAASALTTAIKTMGESPKLMLMLGEAYRLQGKLDDAISQYTRAVSDPKVRNPEARLALGMVLREKKDFDKAREALEKASQEFVGQPNRTAATLTELGRLYHDKGDRPKAEENFRNALNADADFAPSYFFYARLLSEDAKQVEKAKTLAQEYLKIDAMGPYGVDARRLAGL